MQIILMPTAPRQTRYDAPWNWSSSNATSSASLCLPGRHVALPSGKKDDALRLCQDYRELNKRLVADSGGLGDIQSILDRLHGKRFFSTIDLASGFFGLEIHEDDRDKNDFCDADGPRRVVWKCNRAGFGLQILPTAFADRVGTTLSDIRDLDVEN